MGFSPRHSTLVTLILNLSSGSITPQFHVVFDDMFHTVASQDDNLPEIWSRLIDCGPCHMQVMLDEDVDFELHDDWLGADERTERDNRRRQQAVSSNRDTQLRTTTGVPIERENEPSQLEPPSPAARPTRTFAEAVTLTSPTPSPHRPHPPPATPRIISSSPRLPVAHPEGVSVSASPLPDVDIDTYRRSSRVRSSVSRYNPGDFRTETARNWNTGDVAYLAQMLTVSSHTRNDETDIHALLADLDAHAIAMQYIPTALASKRSTDPDTPTYRDAVFGDHGHEYWKAMLAEIEALTKRDTWDVLPRDQVPKGESIVPGTWAFKCKRRPDGTFRKFKSC